MKKRKYKKFLPYLVASIAVAVPTFLYRRRLYAYVGKLWDEHTERKVNELHPQIRARAKRFLLDMQSRGVDLRITNDGGYRSFEEQTELWKIGRFPATGNTVTNAQAGESYHNYGLAFDVVPIVNGKADWNSPYDKLIGEIGKQYGFEWGGDFSNRYDWGHLEETKFGTVWELKNRYLAGDVQDDGYLQLV